MKKFAIILLPMALLLSGCALWEPYPALEAVERVQTMGVDLDDGVRVSVTTGADATAEHIDETGETLSLALDALRERSEHAGLFYGQTQYLLLGEDYARAGVQELLDFAARSAELRLATPLYVLRGTAADALLDEELDVTGQLAALARTGTPLCTTADAADALAQAGCVLVGALRYDSEAQTLRPDGCAILADGRLTGYLDAPEDVAAAWLSGADGEHIALDAGATLSIKRCRCAVRADWNGDVPTSLSITLDADASVDALYADLAITDDGVRAALEYALARELCARMAAAVQRTQALHADALGFGARLAGAHPLRWRQCAADWAALYPTLPVTVTARTAITGTQDLTDPLPVGGGA